MRFSPVAVGGTSNPEGAQDSLDRDRADLVPPASLADTLVVAEDRVPVTFMEPEDRVGARMGICCA